MDLFMVEVRAADWPGVVSWYRDVLGLPVLLVDEEGRFALLDAGPGHVAIKEGGGARGAVRLVFRVKDVENERARLRALGVAVGEVVVNPSEGYREVRLDDPEGTPIRLFDQIR